MQAANAKMRNAMASDTAACASRVRALSALAGPALPSRLPAAEARELEHHLAGCARCTARLASLREQGAAVRAHTQVLGDAVDLTGFADRVLRAVERDQQRLSLGERARVVSLEQWALHRPLIAAAAGVALAASVLLGVFLQPPPRQGRPALVLPAQASVDFLELDGQAGAVLESPGQTTVIWVNEEVAR